MVRTEIGQKAILNMMAYSIYKICFVAAIKMASQVQRRLDMNFPVRKNTRLRSKSAALQNENKQDSDLVLSPRKRSGRGSENLEVFTK